MNYSLSSLIDSLEEVVTMHHAAQTYGGTFMSCDSLVAALSFQL